jgi:Tol biopolymer transport system component
MPAQSDGMVGRARGKALRTGQFGRRAVQYRGLPLPQSTCKNPRHSPGRAWERALDAPRNSPSGASAPSQPEDRLDSWKKIASYLKRDVTTVQRWERREAMPVHRHLHDKLGSIFAYRSELDAWWAGRQARVAPAHESTTEGQAALIAESASTDSRSDTRRVHPALRRWLGAAAVVLLLTGALFWVARPTDFLWRNPLAKARFTRLSDFSGVEQAAAISRDGKLMAFLADKDGQIDTWISEVGSGAYRNLTRGAIGNVVNPALRVLSFSPDAALVSIWTRRADGSQPGDVNIQAVPVGGGPLQPYLQPAAEFDWSHQGGRLVYHTTAPGDPLFVREPGANRTDRRIYVAPVGVHCHFPTWSPDDAFIYFVRGVPPDDWDLWRIRPSGAGLERITYQNARVAYPVLLDRRTLLYLATDADGFGPWIYALDVERRIPHRISYGLESYTSLAASVDGTRLLATTAVSRSSLWRLTMPNDSATATTSPSPVIANGSAPRLGPDFLVYLSWREDRQGIWTLKKGIAREIWSSEHASILGGPALAPDGRRIAFSVREGGKNLLYVVDSDGSRTTVVADSLPLQGNPAWAPDGKSIVSAVMREGEPRLTRIFLNGDSPLPLVADYSLDPVWSPDGRFLIYSGADVGTTFPLRAAASDGRPYPLPSVMLTRGARRVAFLHDAQSLVILRGEIGHKNLALLDLRTGAEHFLAAIPQDFVIRDFDVSATGSEIVLDRVQMSSDVALIERRH